MALPRPYQKYIYEDPNDYTSVDPNLVKDALTRAGFSGSELDSVFGAYMGTPAGAGGTPTGGVTKPATTDLRSLILNDPLFKQAQGDLSAQGVSDASQRAAAIRRLLIDYGLVPDFAKAGANLGLSGAALGFANSDVDALTRELAAKNTAAGLSTKAKLDAANQNNITAIRNALAARGMYQSGELGYGLGENEKQYQQASTDAEKQVLGGIEQAASGYTNAERARQRDLAQYMKDAGDRQLGMLGDTATSSTSGGSTFAPGTTLGALPSGARAVWDVNSPSTYWGLNAAQAGGAGMVIAEGDPAAGDKFAQAARAGVPVSIQINGDANDTPQTLAQKIAQAKAQYPGASFTLDLESPNFRGGQGSDQWNNMQQFADAAFAAAGGTPITVSTEGVSDFNYGAWNRNGTSFAPQAYWGDMSPRDVNEVAQLLISQGIDPSLVIPLIAPGQSVGSWTGGVGVYGVPTNAPQAASPQPTSSIVNALTSAGLQNPSPAVQEAYAAALPAPTSSTMDYVARMRAGLGME